ncbi:MAG: hypothetical protein HC894_20800 [Microcoleus sp. SM1_3_4]|nr:hypothetical protein [Microcoleus sp. SM1_3_4]
MSFKSKTIFNSELKTPFPTVNCQLSTLNCQLIKLVPPANQKFESVVEL